MAHQFTVRIAFLDVGQGDTIVISIPETEEAVVVDCFDPEIVLWYLEYENIKHLRGLILTHLHLDHYRGAVDFLKNCQSELNLKCERLFFNQPRISKKNLDQLLRDSDGHSDISDNEKLNRNQRRSSFRVLMDWAKQNRQKCGPLVKQFEGRLPLQGQIADVIELLHPWHVDMDQLVANNTSAVLKVSGANCSALLTGDLEPTGWQYLQNNSTPSSLQSEVLKFPHHGAWRKSDANIILDAVNPSFTIISVGTKGIKYKHPNLHVFEAIARRPKIRLLCTQATAQCSKHINTQTNPVASTYYDFAINNKHFFVSPYQSGCPCAGTVIIELAQSVRVLQPTTSLHHQIIKANFPQHKCLI